ncbi:MAG TPA: hypothetical protein VFC99_05140 [Acidimicrobiia bacterium]|nr:hypothetical protein [Acidimicrobiia bacterium]
MRPTPEEQLRGLREVLERVVAPELHAPYPADVLAAAVAALERLEQCWRTVPAALRDESAELDTLLRDARAAVDRGLADAIAEALAAPAPDWLDPAAAVEHHEARRALLAEVVRRLGPAGARAPELWARIVAHLRRHVGGPL